MPQEYTLELDEPWVFLDARGNPVNGRKLTVVTGDGVTLEVNVTMQEYGNADQVKAKVEKAIAEREAVKALFS